MSRAFFACLENDSPILTKSSTRVIIILCKHYTSNTAKSFAKWLHEDNGYDESCENKCATNYSTITNNWNDTHNKQLTMHNTNDDVDFDDCVVHIMRWVCTWSALSHTWWWHRTPHGSSSEQSHCHLHVIHGAFSLTRSLPSSFTGPCCPSPSSSSIPSFSLSSTTRSSWQVCAIPPQKRVSTPWTPSPLTPCPRGGWPSLSVTALRDNTGFLFRPAKRSRTTCSRFLQSFALHDKVVELGLFWGKTLEGTSCQMVLSVFHPFLQVLSNDLHVSIATPPGFLLTLRLSNFVHHLSGLHKTQTRHNTKTHTHIPFHRKLKQFFFNLAYAVTVSGAGRIIF